jgi:hypothetical protein
MTSNTGWIEIEARQRLPSGTSIRNTTHGGRCRRPSFVLMGGLGRGPESLRCESLDEGAFPGTAATVCVRRQRLARLTYLTTYGPRILRITHRAHHSDERRRHAIATRAHVRDYRLAFDEKRC